MFKKEFTLERKRKELIRKLTSHFHHKNKIRNRKLLAYQLGIYLIIGLTKEELKEDSLEYHFEKISVIGSELADFMGVELIRDNRIHEAKDVLIEIGFMSQRKGSPRRRLIEEEGYNDKIYWFWNIETSKFDYY